MYEIIKSVISAGGYKLAEIQHKIKKLYVLGDLTEKQADELLVMAAGGISPDAERPETLAMIKSLSDKITAMEARVKTLEGTDNEGGTEETPKYPKWEPWDGISDNYQYGTILFHIDGLWISDFRGQNVWEPGTPGTEAMWVEYVEEVESDV